MNPKRTFLKVKKITKKLQLGIVIKKDNLLIGMVTAYNFNYFNRTCVISLITDLNQNIKKNRLQIFKITRSYDRSYLLNEFP